MNTPFRLIFLSLSLLTLALSGCSGGGGGGTGPAAAKMVTGVAATGAPVIGTVQLKDSSATPAQLTTTTASDGSFAFNAAGLTPPFIIKATAAASNLYSLASDYGIYNVTPLTTMAVAQAAGGADLDTLYNDHVQSEISAAAAKMANAVDAVQKNLAPLMDKFGVTVNILTGQFSANHSGVDALLDAISISVAGGMVTITNKQNNTVVFVAPCSNLSAGSVVAANMPSPSAAAGNGTPATTPAASLDGATLYATICADCHGALASSTKSGITLARLQAAIANNTGGMNAFSSLTATDIQAIVTALTPATSTPTPTPTPTPTTDGATLYGTNCAGCHGPLASSTKAGITIARLQAAIANNTGGMSAFSSLTATEIQAIVTALTPATPTPAPTPAPTTDGATLYGTTCAGCHGTLASSAKAGATVSRIQTAIAGNTGGMGYLSTLTTVQITAIASALAGVTPSPTPTPACGSCHAIPPATGHHSTHRSANIACATCHGSGYSTTTVNAATHNNGVKNIVSTIGWNATSRSCSNSCHGTHTW